MPIIQAMVIKKKQITMIKKKKLIIKRKTMILLSQEALLKRITCGHVLTVQG